jgi:uncharacterized protein (DUF1330 family)
VTAYAIANLHNPHFHPEVAEYIERIQATLDPFGGRFLVHGTAHEVREGSWPGAVVVIGFPSIEAARDWYESPAYDEIQPLRTRHIDGDLILVDGVPAGYEPATTAAHMRAAATDAEASERRGTVLE